MLARATRSPGCRPRLLLTYRPVSEFVRAGLAHLLMQPGFFDAGQ